MKTIPNHPLSFFHLFYCLRRKKIIFSTINTNPRNTTTLPVTMFTPYSHQFKNNLLIFDTIAQFFFIPIHSHFLIPLPQKKVFNFDYHCPLSRSFAASQADHLQYEYPCSISSLVKGYTRR